MISQFSLIAFSLGDKEVSRVYWYEKALERRKEEPSCLPEINKKNRMSSFSKCIL